MTVMSPTADQDLERRVQRFLLDRNYAALSRLDVAVDQGTVVLKGRVSSFYEKQLAISCVRRVADVRNVDIRIDVAE